MTKYLLIVVVLLSAVRVSAQQSVFTIGPKIGYTFGDQGGITLGAEASYFPSVKDPANDKFRYGFTFDVMFSDAYTTLHLGAEIIGLIVGIDLGPTLIIDDYASSI